ncbi:MAG: hypothetical protein ACOX3W_07085 [Christensenellaceae bacterium]|jgi:phenylpyruvate tautomerase PptA (4-oxalocrotonate tautomerase family)
MPFIQVHTAQKLDSTQKLAIKAGLGEAITLIPNKAEANLMMVISDGVDLYFRGEEKISAAFVDVRLKDETAFDAKAAFTEAVFNLLEKEAGIAKDDTYVNIGEYDAWGSRGVLKK